MKKIFKESGIVYEVTAKNTPHQNSLAEEKNYTAKNMIKCLLAEKNLIFSDMKGLKHLKIHSIKFVQYLKKAPEEIFVGNKPRVDRMRILCSKYH